MVVLKINIPGYDLVVYYDPGEPESTWGYYGATPGQPESMAVVECSDSEDGSLYPAWFCRRIGEKFNREIWERIEAKIEDLKLDTVV